jgi:hypothetical protein
LANRSRATSSCILIEACLRSVKRKLLEEKFTLATDDSQNSPQPRTTTRAIRFRNAAGAISMEDAGLLAIHSQLYLRKKVHAQAF